MSGLTLLIGFLQTTVVWLVTGLLLRLLRKRDPAAAARVGMLGLVGSFVLVGLC